MTVKDILIQDNFWKNSSFSFSLNVISGFFNKASIYLPGRLVIRFAVVVSLHISVVLYNSSLRFVVSRPEKKFCCLQA